MGKIFLTPIDLSKNELQNARIQNLATAPSAPVTGQIYYDTDDNRLYYWNGTSWITASTVIPNDSVTFAQMQNVATDRLLGRDTAAAGDIEELTVGGGIEFTGSGGIQTSARTGDVTKTAGGTVNTIAAASVTLAKMANLAANSLIGNNTGGAAVPLALTAAQVKTLLAIVPADVTGFDTQVRLSRLDQMAIPTASVNANSQKIINLATPTAGTDAATKAYADGLAQGLQIKEAVRVATTANGTLATAFANAQTIDGIVLATGDRILIKNQTATAENGIYTVNAAGAPTRSTDADASGEINRATTVFVEEGTSTGNSIWTVSTISANPWIPGTTTTTWVLFTNVSDTQAGLGLIKNGSALDVVAGTGIISNANDVAINTAVVARWMLFTIGDAAATSFNCDHNFGNSFPTVEVMDATTGQTVEVTVTRPTANRVTVVFSAAPALNAYKVTIVG